MQNSAEADKIISQANAWTFEGDCSLLQWMQQISENLEQHVNKTSKSLDQLSANTKRTGIALDNSANSLTALQYTQFVESRCQDDDETITSATEGAVDSTNNGNTTAPTSTEVLKMFMSNNMQMLQNCHEKYALDFDDSDDDDATTAAANNCVYQAKNPYNERPLPHIYGSKLWKENWHVGLCDGANDYSGDEMSEAFSESSGSIEENESYGSNSAHTSDWASSSSVLHDKLAQNARNLPPSTPTVPATVSKPIPAVVNVSTPAKSLPTSAVRLPDHDDLFATLQHTPPTTTSSSSTGVSNTSSRETSQASSYSSSDKRNTYQQRQPEAATPALNAAPVTEEVEERKPATINIKRKPVNLFDDDDFNSLMSEIVDKAHGNKDDTPIAAPRKLSKTSAPSTPSTNTLTSQTSSTPARNNSKLPNLFDSPRSSPERENTFSPSANAIEVPKSVSKQPLNLFGSPEASPPNAPVLLAATKTTVNTIKKITPKSLFDDDDDDDDFLNVFGAKKSKAFIKPQTIGRKSLFDDDDDDVDIDIAKNVKQDAIQVKQTNTVVPEVIGNAAKIATKENTDFSSEKHSAFVANASNADVAIKTTQQDKEKTLKNTSKKVNLFDDDEEDTESGSLFSSKKSAAIIAKNSVVQSEIEKTASITKKVNLFDDVEDDTKDAKSANNILKTSNSLVTETKANVINELKNAEEQEKMAKSSLLSTKVNLFDDVEDEDKDDDMFSSLEIKSTHNAASENIEEKVVSEVEEAASIPMPQQTITENVDKEVRDKTFANTTHISKVNEQTNPTTTKATVTEDEQRSKNVREDSDIPKIETEIEAVSNKSEVDEDPANQTVTRESSAPTNPAVEIDTLPTNDLETVLPDTLPSITPAAKPTTTTNYANIFLDEPPDDDDFFQTLSGHSTSVAKSDNDFSATNDFYEPPLPDSPPSSVMTPPPTTTATKETKSDTGKALNQKDITSNSASDYSGLRLFSDIPPDDYDVDNFAVGNAVEQTKTLHSVFYDDFNETATATQTQATANKLKMPQHALFDDEPPADDDDFGNLMGNGVTEKGAGDAFTKKIEAEQKMPQKEADETDRVSQVSNEIAKTIIESVVEEEKPNIPQIKPISKLPKLNINVKALLPNPTGRLNFKKTSEANSTPNTSGEDSNTLLISPQTTTPTPTSSVAVVADAGNVEDGNDRILTSLCKTRVRAPAQRRPSTRRGRQENYRKSLLMAEDDTDDVTIQTQQQTSRETTTLPTSNVADKIPSEIQSELEHKHDTTTATTVEIPQKETEKKLGLSLPTFLDANDDDDDDFMYNASASNINKTPGNLFSTTTSIEDEQLTKSVDKVVPILPPSVKPKKSMKDLFDDSDASDAADDLFASKNSIESENLSSKTSVTVPQTTASTTNPFNTESVQQKVTPKTLPTTAPIKPKAKSLFSDTDSDSGDDLFKTTGNKSNNNFNKNNNNSGHSKSTESTVDQLPQPKQIPVKNSTAKLFDSDSDDNDSNFLGSLKTKQHQPQGKPQTVKASASKESKGLFSDADSDDDDDLFGSRTKKAAVNKSIPSKPGTSTTKAITTTTTTAITPDNITGTANAKLQDNPLADLLN